MKTARDLLDELLSYANHTANSASTPKAKAAISEALREIGNRRNWSYLYRQGRIQTSADYSTGTVVYDHAGGAHERMLTLTTGTWPSWAANGVVVIDGVHYRVNERISSSIVTLESDSNPGEDVSSTTYAIYQQHYSLPTDFKQLLGAVKLELTPLRPLEPREYHAYFTRNLTASQPWGYTIIGDEDEPNRRALYVVPFPDAVYNIDYKYLRYPRAVQTWEYLTGTVVTTADSTTVTGSGFTSRMEGAVLRWAANQNEYPTDLDGANPYQQEVRIRKVVSSTSLRVSTAATDSYANGVKFVISDPIDIDQNTMLNYFRRLAEKHYSIIARLKNTEEATYAAQEEYQVAASADSPSGDVKVVCAGARPYGPDDRWLPLGSDQGT